MDVVFPNGNSDRWPSRERVGCVPMIFEARPVDPDRLARHANQPNVLFIRPLPGCHLIMTARALVALAAVEGYASAEHSGVFLSADFLTTVDDVLAQWNAAHGGV